MIIYLLSTNSARGQFLRKFLDRIHAKMGNRNLCILGGLFTIELKMGMIDWYLKMSVVDG